MKSAVYWNSQETKRDIEQTWILGKYSKVELAVESRLINEAQHSEYDEVVGSRVPYHDCHAPIPSVGIDSNVQRMPHGVKSLKSDKVHVMSFVAASHVEKVNLSGAKNLYLRPLSPLLSLRVACLQFQLIYLLNLQDLEVPCVFL
jgi:hypothetical protein